MPKREPSLVQNEVYHIFNRGVEKRNIFLNEKDYKHFLETLEYYQVPNNIKLSKKSLLRPKRTANESLVEILCYCLMPNHFHLLIRQKCDNGISIFMNRVLNSFTKYFNTKNERIGPLFQGRFKAVRIESDEQLLHVSRYIHLNPLVSDIVGDLKNYQWSSYPVYAGLVESQNISINPQDILAHFSSNEDYKKFVADQADYARSLEEIKHRLFD